MIEHLSMLLDYYLFRGALYGLNLHDRANPEKRFCAGGLIALAVLLFSAATVPDLRLPIAWLLLSPVWLYALIDLPELIIENRAYISLLGIAGIAAWVAERAPLLVAGLIVFYVFRTLQRLAVWSDPVALWKSIMADWPEDIEAKVNYATALHERGWLFDAERQYRELVSEDPTACANLVALCAQQKRYEHAVNWGKFGLKRWPQHELLMENTVTAMKLRKACS